MTSEPIEDQGLTAQEQGRDVSRTTWVLRAVGVVAAVAVWLALGASDQLGNEARAVAAIATLMAVWWTTEAVPLSATSLLPIVLLPALTSQSVGEATAPYASSIVFLFLGGFLIAIAMEKWELHRRIALLVLRRVGVSPRRIILGMMIATGFISMWVSNTATTLMMLPIGMSVLHLLVARSPGAAPATVAVDDPNVGRFGLCLLLSIAWSSSMGGLGTLLGSPPNAIVAGYVADELGREISFLQWMVIGVPIAAIFIAVGWVLMTRVLYRFDLKELPGGRRMIDEQLRELGPMSRGEWMVAAVFCGAAFLWVVPGLLAQVPSLAFLDVFNDTSVAIGAGVILFLLPAAPGRAVLRWSDAENGLPWGVLLLFGGGLSLASAVAATGLDSWLGLQVSGLGALPPLLLVGAVTLIVMLLTEVTSNTATAATFIPVLGGVAIALGIDPMLLLVPAAFAATCAFMLPVGTPPNAIVFGTGNVTIGEMARGGIVLNVVGVILITLLFYLLFPLVF